MISYDQYECKIISYYELGMDKEGNWYMDSAHEHEFPEDENPPHGSNTDEEMEGAVEDHPIEDVEFDLDSPNFDYPGGP